MQNHTNTTVKKYIMVNKETGARIECTPKYLFKWLELGFEVEEIELSPADDSGAGA